MSFERHFEPRRPELRQLVRHYTSFEADVGCATVVRAAPVRPQQFLQLVLEGDHRLINVETGHIVRSAPATLIGLCTYRKYNLQISGRLRLFFVQFQPGALHALSGRDMQPLTDGCLDARQVFGKDVLDLVAALAGSTDASEQAALADAWFASRSLPQLDGVAAIARSIRDSGCDRVSLGIAEGLSARQFQRRFARQIGVTPKVYARLSRLAAVIDMREASPELSWTELAHANGYADQAHLTREFRAFVRAAPSRFNPIETSLAA